MSRGAQYQADVIQYVGDNRDAERAELPEGADEAMEEDIEEQGYGW